MFIGKIALQCLKLSHQYTHDRIQLRLCPVYVDVSSVSGDFPAGVFPAGVFPGDFSRQKDKSPPEYPSRDKSAGKTPAGKTPRLN